MSRLWDLIHGQVPVLALFQLCPPYYDDKGDVYAHNGSYIPFLCREVIKSHGKCQSLPQVTIMLSDENIEQFGKWGFLPGNSLSSPLTLQVFMNPSLCAQAESSRMKPGMTTPGLRELAEKYRVQFSRAGRAISRRDVSVPGQSVPG